MTSIFSTPDEARCKHYARFASHLDRKHFDIIYWFLFILVIIMLCLASARYMSAMEQVAGLQARTAEYNSKLRRCMIWCTGFTAISVVAVVLEVFVLMALQFCDGEDLMSIYWSTWTMLQVGSLIAVFGILLHVFHMLRGRKHPPWALALGTPVLVVAGVGHMIHSAMKRRAKSVRARSIRSRRRRDTGDSGGTADTIRIDSDTEKGDVDETDTYNARLIGFTPEGGPILQFRETSPPPLFPAHAMVIGTDSQGCVTVAVRRPMTTVISKDGKPNNPPTALENNLETMKKPEMVENKEPRLYAAPTQPKPEPPVCAVPKLPTPPPPTPGTPTPGSSSSASTKLADEKEPVLSFSLPTLNDSLHGDTRRGSSIYRRSD